MDTIPERDDAFPRSQTGIVLVRAPEAIAWHAADDAFLVDVREPFEVAQARIPGAHMMPLSELDPRAVPDPGGRHLMFYCATGIRCGYAANALVQFNYPGRVHRLEGGIAAWIRAGGPVVGPACL